MSWPVRQQELRNRIVRMRTDGDSVPKIAKAVGKSESCVRYHLAFDAAEFAGTRTKGWYKTWWRTK